MSGTTAGLPDYVDGQEGALWARQVADELSVLSGPSGTCATVVFALG